MQSSANTVLRGVLLLSAALSGLESLAQLLLGAHGNAARIVNALDADQIIFLPDEYLAQNVARETGKSIIFPSSGPVTGSTRDSAASDGMHYDVVGWTGRCEVHEKFTVDDILSVRHQFLRLWS